MIALLLASLVTFAPLTGEVPEFAMETHRGDTIFHDSLSARPVLFSFVFASCAGACPRILGELESLDRDLAPEVLLLCVTVDPANDTPGVLARLAADRRASDRWIFATTGDTPRLLSLLGDLKVGGGDGISHSNRLVLARDGRITGAYDALDPADLALLRRDLGRDPAPPDPRAHVPVALRSLPALNAFLNAVTTCLLVTGLVAIRRKRVTIHKRLMLSAVAVSVLFLVSYLSYHAFAGTTRFTHPGRPRTFYLSILLTHTILAGVVAAGVPFLVHAALTERIERHKFLARIIAPIWLYVSVTGVGIYLMLYRIWPSADILGS